MRERQTQTIVITAIIVLEVLQHIITTLAESIAAFMRRAIYTQ